MRSALLPLALAALLAAPPPATPAQEPPLIAGGKLRVLTVDGGSRFFLATTPGGPGGFDRELLDGFARLHHLEVEVVPVPTWADLLPALLGGKGDVVAGQVSDTEARRRLIAFTVETFPTRNVVVTRSPHRAVWSLEELREERVGTIKGTSLATLVNSLGLKAANVDDSLSSRQGALSEALRAGRVTAVVNGVEGALKDVEEDGTLQIGMFVGPPESLAFGVRKEDRRLLASLNDYITNLRKTPTWNRLVVKYFGPAAVEILRRARTP
jgi:ABC-type amino acid transport substrate-binding protein